MLKLLINFAILVFSINLSSAAIFDAETTKPPELRKIELISFSPEKNTATFAVTLFNPNLFKIPVREMTSTVQLNQQEVATVDATSKQSLKANAEAVFTVPITVRPLELQQAIHTLLNTNKAQYRIEAYLMTPVGEMPVYREGHLSTEDIMLLLRHTFMTTLTP